MAEMSPTFVRLQKLARTQSRTVDELARSYVLEGMLDRIFACPFAADFVLKGGVLLAAYALRRPTKDIDVEVSRIRNNATDVTARITEIADIGLDDGIAFDLDFIRAETIRDDDDYQGIRVRLTGVRGALSLGNWARRKLRRPDLARTTTTGRHPPNS